MQRQQTWDGPDLSAAQALRSRAAATPRSLGSSSLDAAGLCTATQGYYRNCLSHWSSAYVPVRYRFFQSLHAKLSDWSPPAIVLRGHCPASLPRRPLRAPRYSPRKRYWLRRLTRRTRSLLGASSLQVARGSLVVSQSTRDCPNATRANEFLGATAAMLERGVGDGDTANQLREAYDQLKPIAEAATKSHCATMR